MDFLLSILNWFSQNILQKPAFFVGILVLIGYILLKKPWYDVFAGFVKATVGYMILNVASAGLVSTFRPILAALNYRFNIGAAVIDPYFGLTAAKENNDSLKGLAVTDEEMARKAVNYIFETPGGTIYHGVDSHFSNYFAKHGKDFDIDVAINNYGDNPIGIQDKMTSIDLLRMAENLRAKVIIPVHYDIWSNFMASTDEILALWKMRKERLQYQFYPFIWEVGGKYVYPQDKDRIEYHHPRGFDDAFEHDSNIQFKALL